MSVHKGGHLRKYFEKAPWYLISSISTKLMGVILLPIYTRYFSQEAIGILSVYESFGRMIVVLLSLYLDAAFIRYYYKIKSEKPCDLPVFFSTHFWFLLLWGGGISLALMFIQSIWALGLPESSFFLVPALVMAQLFSQLVLMVTSIWTANLQAKKIALFNISFSVMALLLTLMLIIEIDLGWESRIYALAAVANMQLLMVIVIALKSGWLKFRFSTLYIKTSLAYSVPLLPNIAAGWIAMFSDRMIMAHYGLLDQAGIYSISAQVAIVLYMFNDAITKIQGPLAMSGMTENIAEAKEKMAVFVGVYSSLIIVAYISLSVLVSASVTLVFGDAYQESASIFMILGWVYIFSGLYRVFTNVISFHNATWIISVGAFVQAAVNICMNLMFIPVCGMYAAAISTVVSMMAYTVWIFVWSQKLDYIKVNYRQVSQVLLTGLVSVVLCYCVNRFYYNQIVSVYINIVIIILAVLIIYSIQTGEVKSAIVRLLKLRRFYG